MKEFIKKCPFVFSLLLSMILVLDFYVVKYEKFDLKLNLNITNNELTAESADENAAVDVPLEVGTDDTMPENSGDLSVKEGENDSLVMEEDPLLHPGENSGVIHEASDEENEAKVEEEFIEEEKPIEYVTEFVTYEPKETHSPYYSDPGKKALTTNYPYCTVDESYFADAAFIGDSRTLGLFDYAGFDQADFYADNGFCAYLWKKKGIVTLQNTHEKVNLEEELSKKTYGKIYLMVGMNDCGYGNTDTFKEIYEEMIEMLEEKQPDAIIYLVAVMNVTKAKSEQQTVFNAVHINDKNVAIAECANGMNRFYLDYNDLYSDEEGYLLSNYSFDGIHLYGNKYDSWIQFFKEHAVATGE